MATDIASRGIDVEDITHVFNFDLPNEPEVYIHRIGALHEQGAKGWRARFATKLNRLLGWHPTPTRARY